MNMHIIYHLKKKLLLFEDLYIFFESENKREINLDKAMIFQCKLKEEEEEEMKNRQSRDCWKKLENVHLAK